MTPERPRDGLGRPLSRDADLSLVVPGVKLRASISDEEAWREALDYLDRGLPFHAHEVFEMRWRQAPAQTKDLWRALAQWGAALTHHARGNDVGARAVADRALALLGQSSAPACIDVELVRSSLIGLAADDPLDR